MGRRIREHDWRSTPLGAPETWPQSLRSALNICLHSTFPTAIYWGEDLRLLYNDAWAPVPGPRHPWALGRRAIDVWSDIWPVIGPQFAHVMTTGEGFYTENQLLPMQRYGYPEETYWNYSLTPIFGEDGSIAGLFNSGSETTASVLAEERAAIVLEMGDRFRELDSARKVKATAAEILGRHLWVARAGYAEVEPGGSLQVDQDWSEGKLANLAGKAMSLQWLGSANVRRLESGRILRIDQAVADAQAAAFGVLEAGAQARSLLMAPLVRSGRLLAAIYLHDTEPRHWRDSDALLAQEAVERTWSAVEQARAEAALRESEARFRNLADNAPVMVWVTDKSGRCEYLNKRWYEFTGQNEESALGTGWLGAVHPDDADQALQAFLDPDVSGPSLLLPPPLAQTLALTLHELATNAAKHGSLSGPNGTLAIEWRLERTEKLIITWAEKSERPIAPPDRRGFGSELLLRSVEYQARGSVRLDWRPTGLVARLAVPLHRSAEHGGFPAVDDERRRSGRSVLIVEDETLIALELEQRITSFGYEVVGCIGSVDAALAFAREKRTDIALLDANLNGRSSVEIAMELRRRGVPLAFITGYERIERLPEELRDVATLTKPVSEKMLRRVLSELAAKADG